jgi:endonuclease/exonuclease/phosphatase family metal-dependent hydrolase
MTKEPIVSISVMTWNTEWATPSSDRGRRIASIVEAAAADIAVVTEGVRELLPSTGSVVDAGDNWGYGPKPERRKVVMWSRYPLTLDLIGTDGGTRGRLAVATAATPAGPLRILGVCIPWRDAHVNTGRGDASPWSEHMDYLDRLEVLLAELDHDVPTVIAGDFNQRIPRVRQPVRVADRLNEVLGGWTIHTAGDFPNGLHIDHIATDRRFVLESARDWPASDHLGRLSDHAGVICRLTVAAGTVGQAASTEAATNPGRAEQETDTAVVDDSPRRFGIAGSDPVLTPQIRAEIEGILRRAPDGFEHGIGFRLREKGLTDAEIINKICGIGTSRRWLNSLDRLLSATRPTSKSAAKDTSYGYRELFNHHRTDDLDRYARAWLHELKSINPDDVNFEPLKTRAYQYGDSRPKTKQQRPVEEPCPECGTSHPGPC